MNLGEYHNWLRVLARAESTIDVNLRRLRHLEKRGLDIDAIAWKDRYKIAEFLYAGNYSEAAINNYIRALNSYLKFMNEYEGTEFFERDFHLKKIPSRGEDDVWSPSNAEAKKIMAAEWKSAPETQRNRLLLKILFTAGLRREEAAELKYSDFRIRHSEAKGLTGYKFTYIFVRHGKGNRKRSVPVPNELRERVLEYRKYYGSRSDYIFENRRSGKPLTGKTVGTICKEAGEAAEVKQFHTHAARHWWALDLDSKKVPIQAIQRFLGHSNIATTYSYLRGRRRVQSFFQVIEADPMFEVLPDNFDSAEYSRGEDILD